MCVCVRACVRACVCVVPHCSVTPSDSVTCSPRTCCLKITFGPSLQTEIKKIWYISTASYLYSIVKLSLYTGRVCTLCVYVSHVWADLLHSDSPPAAPRHTCPPETGTSAGHPSDMCCVRRRWSSCTTAGSCPGSDCSVLGWRCPLLGSACNL